MQFDLALIERFGLTVHGFDPTPRVAEWLQNNPPPDALKFYPLGLAWTDGELQFAAPTEAQAVSGTVVPSALADQTTVAIPVARLETMMRDLGHDHLDVLKMDIEGAEYAVLETSCKVISYWTNCWWNFTTVSVKRAVPSCGDA